jgi:hypothetical protein
MFDHVVLRRAESGTAVTAGQIAEALLFYQKVHLVIDRVTLLALIGQIGAPLLVALTGRPDFSAVYTEEILATVTNSVGVSKCHDFGAFVLYGDQNVGQLKTVNERLQYELELSGVGKADAKRLAVALLRRVPVRKLSGDHFVKGGVPEIARKDLQDPRFLHAAVREILAHLPGGYDPGAGLSVEVIKSPLGHFIYDNIDFKGINERRAAMAPTLEPVTLAHVLSFVQDARADMALAAHYGGDFVTSTVTSAVVRLKYETLLQRSGKNATDRREFANVVLPDVPTVAEAVDSGERSFQDFLKLLDKSDRFRSWLKSANPDEGLTREYLKAVTSQDWIQTTKPKTLRYLLALAADAVSPVAGFAAGFADTFLVEKLLSGWRPSHFVNDRLVPFLTGGPKT